MYISNTVILCPDITLLRTFPIHEKLLSINGIGSILFTNLYAIPGKKGDLSCYLIKL